MHPEIMRELTAQRGRDLRERAYRAQLARTLRTLRRSHQVDGTDEFVAPAIPDYIDGSFRTDRDEAASSKLHSRVPAARHAA
jgi:hypothetical protein